MTPPILISHVFIMRLKLSMNNCAAVKRTLVMLCALLLCGKAYAHFPTLQCETDTSDDSKLYCVAGYSDASLAGEVTLSVYSYDEELIKQVTTASDGSVLVDKPEGEYYIVFDPGHESPAEFDYSEL